MAEEIKLMTVSLETTSSIDYPRILLTGEWLIELGFLPETLVSAVYDNGVLTLKAQGTGMDQYSRLVPELRRKKGQLFQVLYTNRNKGNTISGTYTRCQFLDLDIYGTFLSRLGFRADNLLIVHSSHKQILIKKLEPQDLGLNNDMTLTTYLVRQRVICNKTVPAITLDGKWLDDAGFKINTSAHITYEDDGHTMIFTPHPHQQPVRRGAFPKYLNFNRKWCYDIYVPRVRFSGQWLADVGYQIDDPLVLAYRHNKIILKKLDLSKFFDEAPLTN